MLSINKHDVWAFWPSSICENFSDKIANKYISGEYDFEIYTKFSVEEDVDQRLTIISMLPTYVSYDLYNQWVNGIVVNTDDGVTGTQLEGLVKQGKIHELVWKNKKNSYFEVILDSEIIHITKNFPMNKEMQILFGAGNIPSHEGNHNYCALNLYEFKITVNNELLSYHTFDKFIENKSVDITGNCNFIQKLT